MWRWLGFLLVAIVISGTLAVVLTTSDERGSRPEGARPRDRREERHEEEHEQEEADEPGEALRSFIRQRSRDGRSPVDPRRYAEARAHVRAMPRFSLRSGSARSSEATTAGAVNGLSAFADAWTSLGPGNIGGRVRSLVIDPTAPTTMYAGGVDGGVWKTVDGGASWTPTSDLLPSIAVASLVMDPTDHNVLYAGTGEGTSNFDAVRGEGILRTADAGATWQRLSATTTSDFYYVGALVVSPIDHRRIYAATGTGVWRSADSGTTWTRVLNSVTCLDLAVRSASGKDFVLASCGNGGGGSVSRTTNGAAATPTWSTVLAVPSQGRTSIAASPSSPTTVYALLTDLTNSNALALYRSTNGGATWTARSAGDSAPEIGTQGWYDNALAVDPVNANRVWAGFQTLARSTDGGATWTNFSYFSCGLHPDHHRVVFAPGYDATTNRTMFIVNDGGVWRTTNALGTPDDCAEDTGIPWESLNHGLAITQFHHGLPYLDGHTYFGGTQDNGTDRGTDAAGPDDWSQVLGGDGAYVGLDPSNAQRLYAGFQARTLMRSDDGGTNWQNITNGLTGTHLFISPLAADPRNGRILWSSGDHISRTIDGGDNWVPASTVPGSIITAFAISSTDSNRVVAGDWSGRLLRSTNALAADATTQWAMSTIDPNSGYVSSVALDPNDETKVYATVSTFGNRHVWLSTDSGATFTSIDGAGPTGLPDVPASSIVVDPTDGQRLYVGTDLGVFVSLDGGANWAQENSGFANVLTTNLAMQSDATGRHLFAFTHGRGAFRVALPGGPARPVNDASASPITLTDASGVLKGNNVAATREPGEPVHAVTGGQSVWYQYVAQGTGTLTVDTAGSDFDTLLAAYSGGGPGIPTQVAANNDVSSSSRTSRISIALTPGASYSIAVDGAAGANGTLALHWSFADTVLPVVSIGDVSVVEGASSARSARFTVSLSQPTTEPVSVAFTTSSGSATAGVDFSARSGTVSIAAGSTTTPVSVPIVGDSTIEAKESFSVQISDPQSARIGRSTATGRIVNDDPSSGLRIAVGDASIVEGRSGSRSLRFTVSLSAKSTSSVSVAYATANGTATAGTDYSARSGLLTIPAGATSAVVSVPVTGDATLEPDEAFTLKLTQPIRAAIGRATGTATIRNDDE